MRAGLPLRQPADAVVEAKAEFVVQLESVAELESLPASWKSIPPSL
jgi:hypothetical protein